MSALQALFHTKGRITVATSISGIITRIIMLSTQLLSLLRDTYFISYCSIRLAISFQNSMNGSACSSAEQAETARDPCHQKGLSSASVSSFSLSHFSNCERDASISPFQYDISSSSLSSSADMVFLCSLVILTISRLSSLSSGRKEAILILKTKPL